MNYSCHSYLFRYVLPASAQRDQHILQPNPVQEPLCPPAHCTAGGRPASPACPAAPATAVWVWMDIYLPSTYVQRVSIWEDFIIRISFRCPNRRCGFRLIRARIFKLLRRPRIDSKESVPPACVAWQAGTTTLFLLGSSPP